MNAVYSFLFRLHFRCEVRGERRQPDDYREQLQDHNSLKLLQCGGTGGDRVDLMCFGGGGRGRLFCVVGRLGRSIRILVGRGILACGVGGPGLLRSDRSDAKPAGEAIQRIHGKDDYHNKGEDLNCERYRNVVDVVAVMVITPVAVIFVPVEMKRWDECCNKTKHSELNGSLDIVCNNGLPDWGSDCTEVGIWLGNSAWRIP
jgi:hypothetical protein